MKSSQKKQAAIAMGWLLRGGVILSGFFILLGFLMGMMGTGAYAPVQVMEELQSGSELSPHSQFVWKSGELLGLVVSGDPRGWMIFGLLILIGLPILRVLFSAILFFMEKDFVFVLFSLLVLVNLLIGILSGGVG